MTIAIEAKGPGSRSPKFPFISLPRAIDLAKKLYIAEKKNPTHKETVARHWGYKPISSGFIQSLAALRRFGLLENVGDSKTGQVKVTLLAMQIILDDDDQSAERVKAIQNAALNPKIYRELWVECNGDIPSDANLRRKLIFDKGFTDTAADDFVSNFRKTIIFADLQAGMGTETAIAMDVLPNSPSGETGHPPPPAGEFSRLKIPASKYASVREISLPISGGTAIIKTPYPMSADSFDRLIETLKIWKDEFVKKDA